MIVRRERSTDHAAVRSIHVAAFARNPGEEPAEARLLDELRVDAGWIAGFSFVAEIEGTVVGHAICTRGYVDETAVLGLGPIAVAPSVQRSGVGLAIMHAMIGAADATNEPLIALLGSPIYYGRFGFLPSTDVGIDAPDEHWREFFQVRTLAAHTPKIAGQFRYAEPFTRL